MARFTISAVLVLAFAAMPANAQFIDCSGGGCTTTTYGLGNDLNLQVPDLEDIDGSYIIIQLTGLASGACGGEEYVPTKGQVRITDRNDCEVSSTNRCRVEIPDVRDDSGNGTTAMVFADLGPLGLFVASAGQFRDYGGNQGHRQLLGTCETGGTACALDTDCGAGDVCLSTCYSDDAISCSSENDAACPEAFDCRTEITWEGIGLCTDNSGVCTSDADCPGEETCRDTFHQVRSENTCSCCQTSLGICAAIHPDFAEYPQVLCPLPTREPVWRTQATWVFDGGRGKRWENGEICPGFQEGVCAGNRTRSCGLIGDFSSGAANEKCVGAPPCDEDPVNEALASACDDTAFGGLAGDSCDFCKQGHWTDSMLADGSPDLTACTSVIHYVGTPDTLCTQAGAVPNGDPQAGCRILNFGIHAFPDHDCNGVIDTAEGRCHPDGEISCNSDADCPGGAACVNDGDLCTFINELNPFEDSNNDGIGDECQCGDGTDDGAISSPDIGAMALCANGAAPVENCDPTLVDATGDNATTAEDIAGIVATVNGAITTSDLECVRNIDTSTP